MDSIVLPTKNLTDKVGNSVVECWFVIPKVASPILVQLKLLTNVIN